jgi:hypothetical protein
MFLLVLCLIGLLAAGTVYAFLRPSGSGPLFRIGGSEAGRGQSGTGQNSPAALSGGAVSVFTGIGRLRIPLAGGPSISGGGNQIAANSTATLIISIAFPYPPGDRAFTEELAAKVGDFRSIATDYFSSLPAEKIVQLDEAAAKTAILKRYNAGLRLGKIESLYFSDLMVIE